MTEQELTAFSRKFDDGQEGGWIEMHDFVRLETALALLRERDCARQEVENWRQDAAKWRALAEAKQQEASNLREALNDARYDLREARRERDQLG